MILYKVKTLTPWCWKEHFSRAFFQLVMRLIDYGQYLLLLLMFWIYVLCYYL